MRATRARRTPSSICPRSAQSAVVTSSTPRARSRTTAGTLSVRRRADSASGISCRVARWTSKDSAGRRSRRSWRSASCAIPRTSSTSPSRSCSRSNASPKRARRTFTSASRPRRCGRRGRCLHWEDRRVHGDARAAFARRRRGSRAVARRKDHRIGQREDRSSRRRSRCGIKARKGQQNRCQGRRREDLRRYAALALAKGKGPYVPSADASPAAGERDRSPAGSPGDPAPARAAVARADGAHARVPFRPRAENALPARPDDDGRDLQLARPPRNGKTSIAEVLATLMKGDVVLPYAVEVDQQVVKVYDQVYHRVALDPVVAERLRFDHRWVVSKRPIVMTGGELTLETLDLIYDETSKFYEAPFQMKANGGIFMVDDFGRQRVSPKDLLNRWIVPLEKRVDYLTLHTGKKIEIPFDMLIIFSTNLDPADLVDEAFLRRIRYKIGIEAPSVEQYDEIFKRICERKQIDYRAEAMSQILAHYRRKNLGLRSCHPRDILEQLTDTARFLGRPAQLTPDLIDMACESYFVSLDPSGSPQGA